MRLIFFLLLPLILVALAACSDTQTPISPEPDASAEVVLEKWVVECADGVSRTFTDEIAVQDFLQVQVAQRTSSQSTCWHYTFDEGTWWVRHCGMTLSQECFYFESPTGQLRSCDTLTGGGPGGDW